MIMSKKCLSNFENDEDSLDLAIQLWCLKEILLSGSYTSAMQNGELKLIERGNIRVGSPGVVTFYDLKKHRFLMALNVERTDTFFLDSKILEHFGAMLFSNMHNNVKPPVLVPDGVFSFHAIAMSEGSSFSNGKVMVANMSDIENPRLHDLTKFNPNMFIDYGHPLWVSDNAFIVGRSVVDVNEEYNELMYFKSTDKSKIYKPWEGTKIGDVEAKKMIKMKHVWKNFDVIYTIGETNKLFIRWTESASDVPGDWSNADQFKEQLLVSDQVSDFLLADLNNDGTQDLLLAIASSRGVLKAFEIPYSIDFKKPEKYTEHLLIEEIEKQSFDRLCLYSLRTFSPFDSYKGKLWIAFAAEHCAQASILVPGDKDWQYARHIIPAGDDLIHGIEAVDMDEDGVADLFISIPAKDNIKVLSLVRPSPSDITTSEMSLPKEQADVPSDPSSFTLPPKGPVDVPSHFSYRLSVNHKTIFVLLVVSLACISKMF